MNQLDFEKIARNQLEKIRSLNAKIEELENNYFHCRESLGYPHREICGLCHRVVAVGFWVPDDIWSAVVHHSYLTSIHCLNCFIERADEKLIDWSKDIKFYAISLRSEIENIHNEKDEMIKFHTRDEGYWEIMARNQLEKIRQLNAKVAELEKPD